LNELFVDTAGWMAMADASDPRHEACRAWRDRWFRDGGTLVSTDCVLDETVTLIRARLGFGAASRWWGQVDGSRRVRWEWIDPTRADKARDWFFRWKDKTFSFTDCTSFVVMRELRQRRVLTTDRRFRQAGFTVVPR
jgi:hypothetical protein